MKTTVGVFFGGRSTEHEISVISANQAMAAIDADKYNIVPIYIAKDGHWYTGDALTDVSNYKKGIKELLAACTEVYMRPVYGDYNLYPAKRSGFFDKGKPVATLDVVIPVLHGSNVEDGIFEGVLETIGIPYAGCNTLASANGMDKIYNENDTRGRRYSGCRLCLVYRPPMGMRQRRPHRPYRKRARLSRHYQARQPRIKHRYR